jgi:Galactose oxidase, central domain
MHTFLHRALPCVLLSAAAAAQQWVPVATQPRYRAGHGMATDPRSGRPLLFGGAGVYNWFSTQTVDADTWRWNGTAWIRCVTSAAPSPTDGIAMATDLVRQRTVLFAGGSPNGETWEWDGRDWLHLQPAVSPPGTVLTFAMAFDLWHGRCVLYDVGAGNDTWLWDGTAWTMVPTPHSPGARYGFQLAFDPGRGRTVLFGGDDGSRSHNCFSDTWEFDGQDWTQITTPQSPSARNEYTMVYDPATGSILLQGGRNGAALFNDTWSYDGVTWTNVTPALQPPLQVEPQMAFDNGSGHVVLFTANDTGAGAVPETWAWDGSTWTRSAVPPSPPVREMHGLADDAHGHMLLFGGYNAAISGLGGATFADTWLFDGARWQAAASVNAPPRRGFFGMATDVARQRVVLFGGEDVSTWYGDTWEWDGAAWNQVAASGPAPRSRCAMAYDQTRGVVVLQGGTDGNQVFSDTWLWNGGQWTQVPAAAGTPGARTDQAMTFDSNRNLVVLFGGQSSSGTAMNDVWEWNGVQWTQAASSTPPAPRFFHDFTYDPLRHRFLLHGGDSAATATDSWEWDGAGNWTQIGTGYPVGTATAAGAAWDPVGRRILQWDGSALWAFTPTPAAVSTYGTGCGNPAPGLATAGRPFLGSAVFGFEVQSAGAGVPCFLFADFTAASVPLPGGCTVLLQTPQFLAFSLTGSSDIATFAVPLPPNPVLQGLDLFAQAALFAPPGGIVLTNGVHLTVGD